MAAWYNEIDPKAAAWLRELIKAGRIADGEVDERDIRDVCPADLLGFDQCHFFAGIGVWSYALRRAGWPDDRPVWTGSCPCQPFSAAGKGAGFDDERHLWPSWFWLIEQCRPSVVFGEQVASKDAEPWLDLVQDDLEAVGYGVGAIPFPSAGVGAPHIRDRLYWVADADGVGAGAAPETLRTRQPEPGRDSRTVHLGNALCARLEGHCRDGGDVDRSERVGEDAARSVAAAGTAYTLAEPHDGGCVPHAERSVHDAKHHPESRGGVVEGQPGPTNGLWRAADWLLCRDGKWRPVEPGTFPLAHGAPARVGRLRGYGNAINAVAAQAWIESYLDA